VGQFGRVHAFDDDADHLAAAVEHAVGQGAHQPGPAAAVNQGQAASGQRLAHLAGGAEIDLGGLPGRTTVDTDGIHMSAKYTARRPNRQQHVGVVFNPTPSL
jgi:hypothetical protein